MKDGHSTMFCAEAQRAGYAEADPTFDVGGIDTAHKLAILVNLAFGLSDRTGRYLYGRHHGNQSAGHRFRKAVRLQAQVAGDRQKTRRAGLKLRVHPTMVPEEYSDRQGRRRL